MIDDVDSEAFDQHVQSLRARAARSGLDATEDFKVIEGLTASAGEITAAEQALGATLPTQYKAFMMHYGGGQFGFLDLLYPQQGPRTMPTTSSPSPGPSSRTGRSSRWPLSAQATTGASPCSTASAATRCGSTTTTPTTQPGKHQTSWTPWPGTVLNPDQDQHDSLRHPYACRSVKNGGALPRTPTLPQRPQRISSPGSPKGPPENPGQEHACPTEETPPPQRRLTATIETRPVGRSTLSRSGKAGRTAPTRRGDLAPSRLVGCAPTSGGRQRCGQIP